MSVPRYQRYKSTAVEWLDEVPAHWQVSAFRRSLALPLTNGIFKKKDDFGSGVLLINVFDIYRCDFRVDYSGLDRIRCTSEEQLAYQVMPGDVFFVRSSLKEEGIAAVSVADAIPEPVVFECHLIRARTNPSLLCGRFCSYLFNSRKYRDQMIRRAKVTTMTTIDQEAILSFPVVRPPVEEQGIIVTFLDQETAKIDALIAEQRRLVELLKEKRHAVISDAVTKGLNPNAPMKDSGVEWMGKVPAHWGVMPLKRDLLFLTSGSRGWADHYSEDGALFIRIGNLTRDGIGLDLSDIQRVSVPEGTEGERTKVRPGDVLFSITAYLGSVGVVPEYLEPAYVSQHVALARLRQQRLLPKWAAYVTLSFVGKTYLETQGYGGTKIQLSLDDVANLVMTVPDTSEQSAIITFLDGQIAQFDTLTAEAQSAIALLQERRTALISAAVTGKIDVRGLVGVEPELEAAE